MSFDLDKMQAVIELGEVIRLQNEALERLVAFRKARPNLMMPNLAKMVEENLKENVQVLYKELNNLHKPPEQQTRYICKECQMAFLTSLPGGICDECRAKKGSSQPRAYGPQAPSPPDEQETATVDSAVTPDAPRVDSATGDEEAVEDAYKSAIGAQDEAEAERLMAEPKAINLPSDDAQLDTTYGEEVSEEPITDLTDPVDVAARQQEAEETSSSEDGSPSDSQEPNDLTLEIRKETTDAD